MGILEYFPGTPRGVQKEVLEEIERKWDEADVFVIRAPVATGKSRIALTLARWVQRTKRLRSTILTPTNILVDQYAEEARWLHTLHKKQSYTCVQKSTRDVKLSCVEGSALNPKGKHCTGCPYLKSMRKAHVAPYGVYNYHIYLAHKLYTPLLLIDEAHTLLNVLRDRAAKHLWVDQYKVPSWVRSYSTLLSWLEKKREKQPERRLEGILDVLWQELRSPSPRFLVERAWAPYRGEDREALRLLPLDVSQEPPIFWPGKKVPKVVLLSATLGESDLRDMGLGKRRVHVVEVGSPIPPERRPIILDPIGSMALREQERTVPRLAAYIEEILQRKPDTKGFIHATYGVAERLREYLADEPRLLWHTRENRSEIYRKYRESEEPVVLVASGLYEGVDLPEDLGRWQIITKVPYPSLAEPAVRYRAETEPSWYAWETIKMLLQASGRICRTPRDYGETLLVDETYNNLYRKWSHLFPNWWKEAQNEKRSGQSRERSGQDDRNREETEGERQPDRQAGQADRQREQAEQTERTGRQAGQTGRHEEQADIQLSETVGSRTGRRRYIPPILP